MKKGKKLVTGKLFLRRVFKSFFIGLTGLIIWLGLGMAGYKLTIPEFDWYDCLLNASMIVSGMGPIFGNDILLSPEAKVFASFYAIISGVLFLSVLAILIAPIAHRVFTKFHLEDVEP